LRNSELSYFLPIENASRKKEKLQRTPTNIVLISYTPSQADVKTFQAIKSGPAAEKYPHAYRWYRHIASFESEFSSLPGDPTKEYTAYGPESSELPVNPAKAPEKAEEEDDEVDLFGSDDEEEDAETIRVREERLAEYKKKKEGKTKPAAKSLVTMDVKPWGMLRIADYHKNAKANEQF